MTPNGRIEVYASRWRRRSQRWWWRLRDANGNIVATSGEGYTNQSVCIDMATKVTDGGYRDATVVVP
jgi:uncharacterized protein YegP (UPF0339 family)